MIAIVYQRFWPYGDALFKQFLDAYRRFDAGIDHNLVVVNHRHVGGTDLQDYRTTVDNVIADAYCFLNCYSEPLCNGWLGRLEEALTQAGLVGATGSYEMGPAPNFPNPHIRTNAFMLARETILKLDWKAAFDKESAWQLECGPRSLTYQVEAMGVREGRPVLVVGRDGTYEPERWEASRTFRSGDQENLLVADNRTRDFQTADNGYRAHLSRLAWHG